MRNGNTARLSGSRLVKVMYLGCCAVTKCCKKQHFLKLTVNKNQITFSTREEDWSHPIFCPLLCGGDSCRENRALRQLNPVPLSCLFVLAFLNQPSQR